MPDKPDIPPVTDNTHPGSQQQATQSLMNEVWQNMAKLGIGPRSKIPMGEITPVDKTPQKPVLAPLEVVDNGETKPPASPLESIIKLPEPPTRIKTQTVTMDVYPTADPGKKEVQVHVDGKF